MIDSTRISPSEQLGQVISEVFFVLDTVSFCLSELFPSLSFKCSIQTLTLQSGLHSSLWSSYLAGNVWRTVHASSPEAQVKGPLSLFRKEHWYKQGDGNHKPPAAGCIPDFSIWGPKDSNCWVNTKRSWRCWGILAFLWQQEVSAKDMVCVFLNRAV